MWYNHPPRQLRSAPVCLPKPSSSGYLMLFKWQRSLSASCCFLLHCCALPVCSARSLLCTSNQNMTLCLRCRTHSSCLPPCSAPAQPRLVLYAIHMCAACLPACVSTCLCTSGVPPACLPASLPAVSPCRPASCLHTCLCRLLYCMMQFAIHRVCSELAGACGQV